MRGSTPRDLCLKIHRWSGLTIALFLLVAGLTGAVIVYQHDLEGVLLSEWTRVAPRAQSLSPIELARIAERAEPRASVDRIPLDRAPHETARFLLEPKIDPATSLPYELRFNEIFLDPHTGTVLGQRLWGEARLDRAHLLPLLYRLHYSLLLGDWGVWLFGVAALLWCLNCIVGFYLTLPAHSKRVFKGWWRSWIVRPAQSIWRLSFDLHRAAGLWFWGVLLIFALSAVQFNLDSVFRPALTAVLPFEESPQISLPRSDTPYPVPQLSWEQALERGRVLMAGRAATEGFDVEAEVFLLFRPHIDAYGFAVKSPLDVRRKGGQTWVYFSARDGRELAFHHPGVASGNLVSTWLSALHLGTVGGRGYQAFVAIVGLAVALLSITGVMVWFKRRVPVRRVSA